ncbi:hypothetical protein NVV94_20160 [Pseudomonas sp. LS1212]|uniref:hypothetical protein n=1 Tax=Pseudomonas sp. LS1212 TaxID=2972478 RepID=UPI00215CAD46|nr:hypothetical protein [Pseudomonas sp. LS1212]UVJ42884.1 hypothetical protein NVV94_20160 [Pseudomonas sp. LS1212]
MEMNAPLYLSYTNEVSPEFLRTLDDLQEADAKAQPPLAIYRLAADFLPLIEG